MMNSASDFQASRMFLGPRSGYYFGTANGSTGYYLDNTTPLNVSPEPSPTQFTPAAFAAFVQELSQTLADPATIATIATNPTFDTKRSAVLKFQMSILSTYGTLETLQTLTQTSTDPTVKANIAVMNEIVKNCYVGSLLAGKPAPASLKSSGFDRTRLLEFLDSCVALLTYPDSRIKLRAAFDKGNERASTSTPEEKRNSPMQLMQDELNELQKTMLECCGFDADYGVSALASIRDEYSADADVMKKLQTFQDAMKVAVQSAAADDSKKWSKSNDGTTKVLSVSHKELDGDAPPGINTVDNIDMNERAQVVNLAKAKQIAVLQQDILAQLLTWSEEERDEQLKFAKQTHDEFVSQVMSIESTEERTQFMLTVNPEVQRTLLVHKVWEDMCKTNGGKPPSIKMNKEFGKKS